MALKPKAKKEEEAPKAAAKKAVQATNEELVRGLKSKEVEVGGAKFEITKVEGCRLELTRKDYR